MRTALNILILVVLVTSCSTDSEQQERETRLSFTEQSAIVAPDPEATLKVATVGPGDKRVFRYEYTIEADPQIADSGYSEVLLFEIDSELSSFTATGLALIQLTPYYRQICFCETNDSFPVTGGTISGTRLSDNQWEVDIEVKFLYGSAEKELKFSGTFVKSD